MKGYNACDLCGADKSILLVPDAQGMPGKKTGVVRCGCCGSCRAVILIIAEKPVH